MIVETRAPDGLMKPLMNAIELHDHLIGSYFEYILKPFFDDLKTALENKGYMVFLHKDRNGVYLGVMNNESDELLIKISMEQMNDLIVANFAAKRSPSIGWEISEKNITINDIPADIDMIRIEALGNTIFPNLSNFITLT